MTSAKAVAGALTAILVYAAAQVGLDLPEPVVAALELVLTSGVIYFVPNKETPRV